MRTDSTNLSDDSVSQIKNYIEKDLAKGMFASKYFTRLTQRLSANLGKNIEENPAALMAFLRALAMVRKTLEVRAFLGVLLFSLSVDARC